MQQIGGQGAGGAENAIFGFTTQNGNVGAGLEDLATYVLKGGTLSRDGDYLEIFWGAQMANNANNKLTAIIFGGTVVASRSAVADAALGRWHYALITRRGAALQVASSDVAVQGGLDLVLHTDPAETLANDITIAFRVQGTAANDVVNRQIQIRKGSAGASFTA